MSETRQVTRLWTVEDVSAFLGIHVQTIRCWRCRNYGPPVRKVGKHLRYDPAKVREWFDNLDGAA